MKRLIDFGFHFHNDCYEYETILQNCDFMLRVTVTQDGKIHTKVIDQSLDEEYTLHLIDHATGSFVSNIREQYENILNEIAQTCFENHIFKNRQTKEIISYVKETYGDELEFLWKNSNNAIWRRKDNKKWYGALLFLSKRKLGFDSDEVVEIIDLRLSYDNIKNLIDHTNYFPGWHMNKKYWYTMILDERLTTDEICKRIDESYTLAQK